NGWKISDERLVEDGGKIYIVIMAIPGQEETKDPFLLELGPRLLEKKDPLLGRYAERIAGLYEQILAGLESANSDAAREKALEIKTKLSQIRGIAGCL
ncbi:MAG: tRNA (adenine(22)-N(1))-methyltransferase TrmK, partial [Desulfotomaculaceae bacterium]